MRLAEDLAAKGRELLVLIVGSRVAVALNARR